MGRYREDSGAIAQLIEADRVHRDVYTDPEIFRLEMERLWSRTWIYVGHTSQVPQAGDFITLDIAAQPVIMVRHTDGSVRLLMNRCAHKGTKVVGDLAGNTGKTFRCPYHAWTYRTDGSLINIPLKQGYDGTQLNQTPASAGLAPVKHVEKSTAASYSRAYRIRASASPNISATRSPPSTTSPTAHRRASSSSQAAACASCTTATGRCSSRT